MWKDFEPSYRKLSRAQFSEKIEQLTEILKNCHLCPRNCGVNRLAGERGYCQAGEKLQISSYGAHFGEEDVLVGRYGSGTIFLTWCNLRCCFCQNREISLLGDGEVLSPEQCGAIMLNLQKQGCRNINLVTPTHFAAGLVESILLASQAGLTLPIVWNCGGYESVEVLRILEGVVDIYMPDIKYSRPETAEKFSRAKDYGEKSRQAVKEMHRQVGDLVVCNGLARRGLLIRHLVLPGHVEESIEILEFIAKEISPQTYVNVMAQYRPYGEVPAEINRPLFLSEYQRVVKKAVSLGLIRGLRCESNRL